MEEEIIETEETPNYNKLRYILDKDGYIYDVSFGAEISCELGDCTEYTGDIPEGYSSIEEWYDGEFDKLNAWKIVDGDLFYDDNKYNELQILWEIEGEKNTPATHEYVKDKLKVSTSVVNDELSSTINGTSLIVIDDAGNYEIPEVKIESSTAENVIVISSNKNILGIEAVSTIIDGVEITINADGTITLNGTSTSEIEFCLNGSSTNQKMLYLIKNNTNYTVSGLTENVSLSLYSYDGIDRTLVDSGSKIINLPINYNITQTTLNIPSGITFEDTIISPQIEVGIETEFIKHKETKSIGILDNNECFIDDLVSYMDKTIIMIDKEVISTIKYYKYQYLNDKFAAIEISESEVLSTVSEMNETVNQQNTKISQITQTVDELNSKITDIADITTSGESSYGLVNLVEVNESEPILIRIRPTTEDISYLYPSENLYPSDDLFIKNRVLRFKNTTTNEIFDYELPDNLLFHDENTYDEFFLNYDSNTCQVIKRVAYSDEFGNKEVIAEEIINYNYPKIELTSGDYEVSLLGYNNAYIFIQLMASNIYTTQFATRVELNSEISQTTKEINLEVSKKVGNDEVISRINQSAEEVTIQANKINVSGVVELINDGTTTIDGSKITTGTINASNVASDIITTNNFQAQNINANKITGGTLDASKVTVKNLSADNITSGTLTGRAISGGSVTGATISGGSIDINKSGYYFNMGTSTSHPNCSGLNVGSGGINVNGLGFNNNGTYMEFANGIQTYEVFATGRVRTNFVSANSSVNILSGGSSGAASNGGMLLRTGNGHITLDASNGGGSVYASGVGVANAKVLTNSGSASSKNTKTNIVKFDEEKYNNALKLLKGIDIYNYDYKYDFYNKRNQYGFIIDEIEKLENYREYFDFTKEKAKVDGEHLDFAVDEKDKNTIEIKQYDSNVLDKYLLTCIKALQNKIDILENKIKEMESEK